MRVAALVPTRNRAATAERAICGFLASLAAAEPRSTVTLAVCDDSDDRGEVEALAAMVRAMSRSHPRAEIMLAPSRAHSGGTTDTGIAAGGPGAARNRGLAALRETAQAADVTMMFDDDVVFSDAVYRGRTLRCDGASLMRQALRACRGPRAAAGCGYVGRQDLSILEHVRLASAPSEAAHVEPATDRQGVENVAPGGISTAFLALGVPPTALPPFPEHYNEDYVWLAALARAGWPLRRVAEPLVHAPPGEVAVTAEGLAFQIYGEIVWLAILEHERYPADEPDAMAAAVEEIASDLRSTLDDPALSAHPETKRIVQAVLKQFLAIERAFKDRRPDEFSATLVKTIRSGLALAPP